MRRVNVPNDVQESVLVQLLQPLEVPDHYLARRLSLGGVVDGEGMTCEVAPQLWRRKVPLGAAGRLALGEDA